MAYGIDPVLPIEFDIPTVRVMKNERMDESDSVKERLVHLHLLEEMREIAKDTSHKKKMKQKEYFDQKIRWSPFHVNDLVLVYDSRYKKRRQRKFLPKWMGPYKIAAVHENGTY